MNELDEAWSAAEEAMLRWAVGARFRSVTLTVFRDLGDDGEPVVYTAIAERIEHREDNGPPAERHEEEADGSNPVAALRALADRLTTSEPA